ncbi:4'-phosphopantetheinyl transferase [Trametes meyenii]|nr:4'-phosphopantetheinyl transferase [Trametes meyenii]
MGILGIGVDVVNVPRMISLIERRTSARLAHRILSEQELAVWHALPAEDESRRVRYLSVRWSVKEAAYKAVYPVARPIWKDFTFHSLNKADFQKPKLVYHPKSHVIPSWKFHASVSHDGNYIFTTVLVETC